MSLAPASALAGRHPPGSNCPSTAAAAPAAEITESRRPREVAEPAGGPPAPPGGGGGGCLGRPGRRDAEVPDFRQGGRRLPPVDVRHHQEAGAQGQGSRLFKRRRIWIHGGEELNCERRGELECDGRLVVVQALPTSLGQCNDEGLCHRRLHLLVAWYLRRMDVAQADSWLSLNDISTLPTFCMLQAVGVIVTCPGFCLRGSPDCLR
mmetsp:Transcript_368/g.969  ORF Transcript_368/g.969 Transcript_368/m.969 type:complete len:207 (+) Transcript_368:523-1143(+)